MALHGLHDCRVDLLALLLELELVPAHVLHLSEVVHGLLEADLERGGRIAAVMNTHVHEDLVLGQLRLQLLVLLDGLGCCDPQVLHVFGDIDQGKSLDPSTILLDLQTLAVLLVVVVDFLLHVSQMVKLPWSNLSLGDLNGRL